MVFKRKERREGDSLRNLGSGQEEGKEFPSTISDFGLDIMKGRALNLTQEENHEK